MGLATGEAELRDGDYFGTVLNRAARVMAAGHGGQILLTDRRRACSAESIYSIWDRDGYGTSRTRSRCFNCERRGCARTFRSLHGVDSNPGNLRPAITSLIGRDAEVSNLQSALRSHRLVETSNGEAVKVQKVRKDTITGLEYPDIRGRRLIFSPHLPGGPPGRS